MMRGRVQVSVVCAATHSPLQLGRDQERGARLWPLPSFFVLDCRGGLRPPGNGLGGAGNRTRHYNKKKKVEPNLP